MVVVLWFVMASVMGRNGMPRHAVAACSMLVVAHGMTVVARCMPWYAAGITVD